MTDVAELRIKVDSDGVPQASRQLGQLQNQAGKTEKATSGLIGTIGKFVSVMALAATATAALTKLISVQRQFDIINVGLQTATGSAQNAAIAFEALQNFASSTPYSLQQVSEAFTKLVNYGLNPSERALTAYGDMSAALGKDLSQLIEAVADASTGEFERLKDFGVKARKQGDEVSFIFRGVTTTVRNNTQEIEGYLLGLSENNFAGNMQKRTATLDGAISNLGDEWNKLFLNLSQSGIGDSIADGVRVAIDALSDLNDFIVSGEMQGYVDALAAKWGPWADSAVEAADIIWQELQSLQEGIETQNPGLGAALTEVWERWPENIKAFIEVITVEVASAIDVWLADMRLFQESANAILSKDTIGDAVQRWETERAVIADSRQGVLQSIFDEREATTAAADNAIADSQRKRVAWEAERDARHEANKDGVLGQFGINPPTSPLGGGTGDDAAAKKQKKDYESLVSQLATDEEALAASYAKRRAILESATDVEASVREQMMVRLDAWRIEEEEAIAESSGRQTEQIRQSLLTEEEAIRESYEARRKIVLDNTAPGEIREKLLAGLAEQNAMEVQMEAEHRQQKRDWLFKDLMTEQDFLRLQFQQKMDEQRRGYEEELISKEEFERNKAEIEYRYRKQSDALMHAQQAQQLDAYGGMLGGLTQMFGQFAQGQGKSAERMFKISKALNMAQAVMSIASGISKAQELGYPMNLIESARVAAVGATQVAAISSQRYSGTYDNGGRIPAGKFGVVGEKGLEVVEGPANVTSRRETARMLRGGADSDGGRVSAPPAIVHINTMVTSNGSETSTQASDERDARELSVMIDNRVREVLQKEERQGGILWKRRNGA